MATCSRCDKPARGNGLCSTHYRQERVRQREEMLKQIITTVEGLKLKRPQIADELEAIIKDAKPLFREFKEKKASPADRMAMMERELAELKAALGKRK